mmetsp:Transcript_22889/g.47764  ORF Transcript_22889/g.47764 Transcript_22889/m.47764 type:complete len:83 (-) Transcript_22889:29-277(-)
MGRSISISKIDPNAQKEIEKGRNTCTRKGEKPNETERGSSQSNQINQQQRRDGGWPINDTIKRRVYWMRSEMMAPTNNNHNQ